MTVPDRPAWRSFPLLGLLCLALVAELACNRLLAQYVVRGWHAHAAAFLLNPAVRDGIDWAGLFSFYFASVLAVLLAALAGVRLALRPMPHFGPRFGEALVRMVCAVATMGFVLVAALGLWQRLPPRLELYLQGLLVLVVATQVYEGWPWVARRARTWLVLLATSLVLHFAWGCAVQLGIDAIAKWPPLAISLGEALAAVLAAAAPMCLLPHASSSSKTLTSRMATPLALGMLSTAAALWLGLAHWSLAARIVIFGLGLRLPAPVAGVVLYALAFGCFVTTAAALLATPGTSRLRGYGLLAVGLAGYQLALPVQLSSVLLGVLCVIQSYRRERQVALSPERWRTLLRRVAARLGAGEVSTVRTGGLEEARVVGEAGEADGEVVEVRLLRCDGALMSMEVVVGQVPSGETVAPLTIQRRGTPRSGRRAGSMVRLGDEAFDEAFVVHDARRVEHGDPVLSDDARAGLRQRMAGWLGVWPGLGVRYRGVGGTALRTLADEEEGGASFEALLALLVDLKRR